MSSFTVGTSGAPQVSSLRITGSLPKGLSFASNINGTAVISGKPLVPGTYKITLSATNGFGVVAVQHVTLQILPSLSVRPLSPMIAGVGNSVAVLPLSSLAGAQYTLTGLPAWATFHESSTGAGLISGTPPVGSGGVYPLVISSSSFGDNVIVKMSLIVDEAPRFASPLAINVQSGRAFTYLATAIGGYPKPISYYAGSLPHGVKFVDNRNGTATVSGAISTKGRFFVILSAACGQQRTQTLLVITSD
jgi:hypothetical protein